MTTPPPIPNVQQNAPVPPGNIPASRRQWIAVGACLLLVVAIAFTSLGGPASPKLRTNPLPNATVTPMTAAELAMATRNLKQQQIEAEEARQKADQAAKLFAQSVASGGAAPAGAVDSNLQGGVPGQPVIGPNGVAYYPDRTMAAAQQPTAQSAMRLERQKREYASLFSSNVALSLRPERSIAKTPSLGASPIDEALTTGNRAVAEPGEAEKQAVAKRSDAIPQTIAATKPADTGFKPEASGSDPELQRLITDRYVPKHVIFEGTILEAVLTNRLTGDFSGPVNAMVTTDVYSHNRQLLMIPQGSRILGETRKVATQNQDRLAVMFHRLIMPDGFSVDLDQFAGLDQAGAAALKDKVDHHYLQVFGTSVALGLLSGFEIAGTASALNANGIDVYRQGVSAQTSQNGMRVLESELNRLPTVTIREGQRIKVYLSKDISLPAYGAHTPTRGL